MMRSMSLSVQTSCFARLHVCHTPEHYEQAERMFHVQQTSVSCQCNATYIELKEFFSHAFHRTKSSAVQIPQRYMNCIRNSFK
jgi:hypothetical protein